MGAMNKCVSKSQLAVGCYKSKLGNQILQNRSVTLRGLGKFLIRCTNVWHDLMQWNVEISCHQYHMLFGNVSNAICKEIPNALVVS